MARVGMPLPSLAEIRSMTINLQRRLAVLAGVLAAVLLPISASAQTYPGKPVRLIVPYVPGGGADIIGRYLAQMLTPALGQTVIVENKPGAGGLMGTEAGLAAPADGLTLTLISSSYTVNPSLYKLKFDPVADITPIVQVSQGPLLVVVNPALPVKSLAELVAYAKARPGKLNYASSGQGSVLHLGAALFADRAGLTMNHVPYKGGGAALNDLLANQVDVYFAATASALPMVKAGKLRPLAVTSAKRIPALPDVPTIAESGFKGYDVTLWYGLIGPKGLPTPIVERINTEVNKVLARKETPAKLEIDGAVPAGGTTVQFQAVVRSEIDLWRTVVTKLGVKPE
jgi:tripartite-type tricarboxylate transporter receptor subunit TctC